MVGIYCVCVFSFGRIRNCPVILASFFCRTHSKQQQQQQQYEQQKDESVNGFLSHVFIWIF